MTAVSPFHPPRQLPGFPDFLRVRPKTPIVGGGGKLRARWKDNGGTILEWNYQHGTIEKKNAIAAAVTLASSILPLRSK